jgi:manganese/zinc/iron transport system ATP- binding protein
MNGAMPPGASPSNHATIEVHDLTVAYRDEPVLWDVDVQFRSGALTAIVGPNGAGKTTLIQTILGLVRPAAGQVRILGQGIREGRRSVAYVPQRGTVDWDFPTTVLDVVLMGTYGRLGWIRRPGRAERDAARAALHDVGMEAFLDRQIRQLSGGQQQRVFLARALVQQAPIFLMDEPFQGVDVRTEAAIVEVLQSLRDRGDTVVVVHHALQTVRDYFDDAVLLNVRRIASGPVDSVLTEPNLKLAYGGRVPFVQAPVSAPDVPRSAVPPARRPEA